MVAGMRSHLSAGGVNLARETENGSLILSSSQDHLVNGRFEPREMLKLLESAVHQAISDGFAGLWAAGDMTWEFGNERNLDRLLEYEHELERFMQRTPALSGVCLYHKDTLPQHAIQTALHSHPAIYLSATLSQLNPQFVKV